MWWGIAGAEHGIDLLIVLRAGVDYAILEEEAAVVFDGAGHGAGRGRAEFDEDGGVLGYFGHDVESRRGDPWPVAFVVFVDEIDQIGCSVFALQWLWALNPVGNRVDGARHWGYNLRFVGSCGNEGYCARRY